MVARTRRLIAAAAAALLLAGAGGARLIAATPETRTIALRNVHTDETLILEYKRNGRFVPAAMEQIDWLLRDWRKDETAKIDPELIDLMWEVHSELGSKEPINVISGYRSRSTNEMLRKTVGGQAGESRHILGKAADVQFPDVPLKQLRYSALIRERGGVGYYPTSSTPFVHLDTDRVRAWPRLPRHELALLFPNGRTRHLPPDGDPITPEDVRIAKLRHDELALQLAEFHDLRNRAQTEALVAQAGAARPQPAPRVALLAPAPKEVPQPAPLPKLAAEPRVADPPSLLATRPTDRERSQLAQLAEFAALPQLVSGPTLVSRRRPVEPKRQIAALGGGAGLPVPPPQPRTGSAAPPGIDGRFAWGLAWVQAPAYDEEHPEETSYRPFPITPFLTQTASPDDPALVRFVAARVPQRMEQAGSMPAQQMAQLLWAQQFNGEASQLAATRKLATGAQH